MTREEAMRIIEEEARFRELDRLARAAARERRNARERAKRAAKAHTKRAHDFLIDLDDLTEDTSAKIPKR